MRTVRSVPAHEPPSSPPRELPPGVGDDPLVTGIALAERVRSDLEARTRAARQRLGEIEQGPGVPDVQEHLRVLFLAARRQVDHERSLADEVIVALTAHAEAKAIALLATAAEEVRVLRAVAERLRTTSGAGSGADGRDAVAADPGARLDSVPVEGAPLSSVA